MDRCNILIAINTAATIALGVLLLLIKIELTGLRRDMPQPVPSISVEGGTATGNTVTVHQGDKPESNREWFTTRDVAEKEGVDPIRRLIIQRNPPLLPDLDWLMRNYRETLPALFALSFLGRYSSRQKPTRPA